MMQLIKCKKKSSVLNPNATLLNNMVDEITWRSMEFLIVFLMATAVNLLSKVANVHVTADDMKHVTELVDSREIKKKLLFASLTGNIANVPQLIGRN